MKKHKTAKTQRKEEPQPVGKPALKVGAAAAVFELRMREDSTQQNMADELGVALRSLTRVESGGKPLTKALAFKLGLLASQRGHEDLARVFRNYLHPGPLSPLGFVSQPAIDSKQAAAMRDSVSAGRGYWRIYFENSERQRELLKQPGADAEEIKLLEKLLEHVKAKLNGAFEDLSKALLPEKEN